MKKIAILNEEGGAIRVWDLDINDEDSIAQTMRFAQDAIDDLVAETEFDKRAEIACEFIETSSFLQDNHLLACWYTMKATPTERIEHYITRNPPCEEYSCGGFNHMGYWHECDAPVGPNHEHGISSPHIHYPPAEPHTH